MRNDKIRLKISIFIATFIFSFLIFNPAPTMAQVSGIDLASEALFWSPYSIKQGDNVFIGTRVKNLGIESAGPFRIMLTYNGFFLCLWDVSKLNPNETFERGPGLLGSSFSDKCVIYSVAPPGYKIKVVVDDFGYIAETNKSNNATSTFLAVAPVSVEPGESTVPGAYVPGYIPSPPPVSLPSVPPAPAEPAEPAVNPPAQNLNLDFLKGLVPCGTSYSPKGSDGKPLPCTVCDFFVLIQNIINFLLYLFASLATLMAIYIAFLFMFSGGSPAKITDAKSKLWLLIIGIFWVLGSWLVLNTILNFAVNKSVFPWPWNQINCSVSQPSSSSSTSGGGGAGAAGGGGAGGTIDVVPLVVTSRLDNNPALPVADYGAGTWEDAVQTDTPGYQAIDTERIALKQDPPDQPYSPSKIVNPKVDSYVDNAQNLNGVDPNLVKAFMQVESSGNPNAINIVEDGRTSIGLMQVRTDTARRYDSALSGLTDAQIGEKLKDPEYSMKIGTAYLQDLASKYGGDLDKVIAAYNGGPGANKASVDCPGSMRWQCQWDNTAQTIPNTGYAVTRDYVVKVNDYYSQLSK